MGSLVAESLGRQPTGRLAGLVHDYVGYRYEGFAPGRHVGLPSPGRGCTR